VASPTPWPLYPRQKEAVPTVQEAGWAPGPVWTCSGNLAPTGIRSPDRPARSESLYRLSYPGPRKVTVHFYLFIYLLIYLFIYLFIGMTSYHLATLGGDMTKPRQANNPRGIFSLLLVCCATLRMAYKIKFHPITCHEGPEEGYKYRSIPSLTSALDGSEWLTPGPGPGCFTPEGDAILIVQKAGGGGGSAGGPDGCKKSRPYRDSIPGPSSLHRAAILSTQSRPLIIPLKRIW
jgi:hypothetical protein